MASAYDDLLDKYHEVQVRRRGTKYEILAAMVCKTLEEHSVVVHDVKLRGESDVKHQIDVTVNKGDEVRRILIECKDFASSGDKVGLGIVRDFESAARDIGAKEAWIISNVGFTRNAKKFAESKGIDLKIVRIVDEGDLEGWIQKIVIELCLPRPINVRAALGVADESQAGAFKNACKSIGLADGVHRYDNVFFRSGSGDETFNAYVSRKINDDISLGELVDSPRGIVAKDRELLLRPEPDLYVGETRISNVRLRIQYDVWVDVEVSEVHAQRIAELIVEGFGSEDLLIFGDDIAARRLGETGRVD